MIAAYGEVGGQRAQLDGATGTPAVHRQVASAGPSVAASSSSRARHDSSRVSAAPTARIAGPLPMAHRTAHSRSPPILGVVIAVWFVTTCSSRFPNSCKATNPAAGAVSSRVAASSRNDQSGVARRDDIVEFGTGGHSVRSSTLTRPGSLRRAPTPPLRRVRLTLARAGWIMTGECRVTGNVLDPREWSAMPHRPWTGARRKARP
jgi:hypothetical protein